MSVDAIKIISVIFEEGIINLLKNTLKKPSYSLFIYGSMEKLKDFFKTDIPDIMIFEIKNSFQADDILDEFRYADSPMAHIPILLIHDNDIKWEKEKGFTSGNIDYIVNPTNKSEIIHKINVLLKVSRLSEDKTSKKADMFFLNEMVALKTSKFFNIINMALIINSERDLSKLMDVAVCQVTKILNADRSSLFLLNPETGDLWSKVAEGASETITLPKGKGIAGKVIQSGEPFIVPDVSKNPFFDPFWDEKLEYKTRNMLCIPVKNRNGQLKGVLEVLNLDIKRFNASDMAIAESCAALIGVTLENIENITNLQALLSKTD
jgi:putative methionine-R-sulfoxide reductase with GAF domain